MLTLETERLLLRDFAPTDWDALNENLSDPRVTHFMHSAKWNEQKRREWLIWLVQDAQNVHRDDYNWVVTLRSDGMLIGWLGISRVVHDARHWSSYRWLAGRIPVHSVEIPRTDGRLICLVVPTNCATRGTLVVNRLLDYCRFPQAHLLNVGTRCVMQNS